MMCTNSIHTIYQQRIKYILREREETKWWGATASGTVWPICYVVAYCVAWYRARMVGGYRQLGVYGWLYRAYDMTQRVSMFLYH